MRRLTLGFASAILLGLPVLSGCGMGDRLVAGMGNNSNRIYTDPSQEVAEALADHPNVPPVTDEMLAAGFDGIRRRASEGDPQAVLILYRVADQQRKKDD